MFLENNASNPLIGLLLVQQRTVFGNLFVVRRLGCC